MSMRRCSTGRSISRPRLRRQRHGSTPPLRPPNARWRASIHKHRTGDLMPTIRANGVELFYDLAGPEGAPVVAFSSSLGTTLEMWDAQVPTLSDRYRCLRYDTRGHGRSHVLDRPV